MARAQQLLQQGLNPEVMEHQSIEKWNGPLPLVMDTGLPLTRNSLAIQSLDLKGLLKLDGRRGRS